MKSILLFFAVGASLASAQNLLQPLTDFRVGVTNHSGMSHDNGAKLDVDEFRVSGAFLPAQQWGEWSVATAANMAYTDLSYSKSIAPKPFEDRRLYSLSVPIAALHASASTPWMYGFFVSPSLATDNRQVTFDDFQVFGALGVAYRFHPRLIVGGGLALFNLTQNPSALPGFGFIWQATDRWSLSFLGLNARAMFAATPTWQVGFNLGYSTNFWNVKTEEYSSARLNIRSLQLGVEMRNQLSKSWWVESGVGYTFANEIELETTKGSSIANEKLSEGLYVRLGLRTRIW